MKASRPFVPDHHGLGDLLRGEPTVLYHGTTASFDKFDLSYSRDELVDRFYGKGIFLSPSKRVAELYAMSDRNAGLPPSVVDDFERTSPRSGELLRAMYELGRDAWEAFSIKHSLDGFSEVQDYVGTDPNLLMDVVQHVVGTEFKSSSQDTAAEELSGLFGDSVGGTPDWVYQTLESIGVDADAYRPKVYTVVVRVENTLVTASKSAARSARSKGYDSVLFHGSDLVSGVPEVAVWDPRKVTITNVEIV